MLLADGAETELFLDSLFHCVLDVLHVEVCMTVATLVSTQNNRHDIRLRLLVILALPIGLRLIMLCVKRIKLTFAFITKILRLILNYNAVIAGNRIQILFQTEFLLASTWWQSLVGLLKLSFLPRHFIKDHIDFIDDHIFTHLFNISILAHTDALVQCLTKLLLLLMLLLMTLAIADFLHDDVGDSFHHLTLSHGLI